MTADKISITEDDGIKLKFPEYCDLARVFDSKMIVVISIILPQFRTNTTIPKVAVSVSLGSTTEDLLNLVFKKYEKLSGAALDKAGMGRYVFKICGYLDYVLHTDVKLGFVDHIIFCKRKNLRIELEMVQLSPADQMDLGPVLSVTYEEMLNEEKAKRRVHGDGWTKDRNRRKREIRAMKNVVHQEDIKWPFRVLVRGIQDCPGEEVSERAISPSLFLSFAAFLCKLKRSHSGLFLVPFFLPFLLSPLLSFLYVFCIFPLRTNH